MYKYKNGKVHQQDDQIYENSMHAIKQHIILTLNITH